MTQAQAGVHFDVSNSLSVMLASLVSVVTAGLLCSAAEMPESATNAITAMATGLPSVGALAWRRWRSTGRQRAAYIAANDLRVNPWIVVFVTAAALGLIESLAGGLVGYVAGSTAEATRALGADDATVRQVTVDGIAGSTLVVSAGCLTLAAFVGGRRAGHFLSGKRMRWFLLTGLVYAALRVAVGASATGWLNDLGVAIPSIGTFVVFYLVLGAIMSGVLFTGWLSARNGHEAFIAQRLLLQLNGEDRHAVVDLLRSTVTAPAMNGFRGRGDA